MTKVDWLIVAFTVLLAVYGYAQGFIVGALSLLGFAIGAFLGTRLAPLLLPGGVALRIRAAVRAARRAAGRRGAGQRASRGSGRARAGSCACPGCATVDGVLGAALTASVALGIAWIVGAVALQSTGSLVLRRDIQRSAILRELNELLPPSGPILHALARFDPLPSVRGPAADVPAPTARDRSGRPASRAAAPQRGQGARHRVRARDRGQRLGGRLRTWW